MKQILSIYTLLISIFCWGQSASVQLSIEPKSADVGEIITITVRSNVQGEVEVDNLPSSFVHGYDVMNGMEQEMDHNTGDIITYYYLAQTGAFGKAGKYTIGPAFIKKGNKTYSSNKVTISIGDKTQMSSSTVTADQLRDPAFGVIQTNKATIYEGEPILVSAKVYANFNPSHLDGYRGYEMTGAVDKNAVGNPSRIVVEPERFKGKQMYAFEYDKNIIFPTGTGTVRITPYTMNLYKGHKSFTFTSNHKTINIQPLPANPPKDFIGGVGDFSVSRTIDATEVKQGDVFKLIITVSGVGNIQNILEPAPKLPKGFIVYGDPIISENFSYCSHGAEGKMVFEYNIQANVAGEIKIPATSISYFDLNQEKYVTAKTSETELKVIEDKNYIVNSENSQNTINNSETDVLTDLRPSQIIEEQNSIYGTGMFWTAITSPFLFAFLFIFFAKRKEKNASTIEVKQQIKKKDNVLNEQLVQLKQLLHSDEDVQFYTSIELALKKSFEIDMKLAEDRLINKREIFLHIDENYSSDLKAQVTSLFSDCEQFRYGFGSTSANKEEYLKQLNSIIQQLKG